MISLTKLTVLASKHWATVDSEQWRIYVEENGVGVRTYYHIICLGVTEVNHEHP
jgi:hypothetical protein